MNSDIAYMEWQNIPFRTVDSCGTYTEIRLLPDQYSFSIRHCLSSQFSVNSTILLRVCNDELTDCYFKVQGIVKGISCYRL